MDKNLFLLSSSEVKLLQDISLFDTRFQGFNGFADVRNRVDVIIQVASGVEVGHQEFDDDIEHMKTIVTTAITGELEKRREEGGENKPPRLPNYEHPEIPEPWDWWQDWDGDDFSDILAVVDTPVDDEVWLSEREEHRSGRSRMPFNPGSLTEFVTDKSNRQGEMDRMSADVAREEKWAVPGRLDDWDLIQLDAYLARLKWYTLRLHTRLSGSLLGACEPIVDNNWKIIGRKVYLFIDNIKAFASWKNIPVDNVIAETFTHEMFHAWYGDIKSKGFLNFYLFGNRYVDEAMTEYGMLCFLQQYNAFFLATARRNVADKFASGKPKLLCYGLGEFLYGNWSAAGLFDGKLLSVYQKISPSPRLGNRLVRAYVCAITRRGAQPGRCMRLLYFLMDHYHSLIRTGGMHYEFCGRQFSYSSWMALSVLREYSSIAGSNYWRMDLDFHHGGGPVFFKRKADVVMLHEENLYDMANVLILSDGTEVVMVRAWTNGKGGRTEIFLHRVADLYRKGRLPDQVHLLR